VTEANTSGRPDPGWAAGFGWARAHADPWGLQPIADGDVGVEELRESVADERLPPASDQAFWDRFVAGVASHLVDAGIYAPQLPDEYV
jgi:hypothetical protein